MAQQLSTNTFGVAKWVVSADATQGTHTTIAGALTSASSGDTILIRNGTYTENLTGKVGVTLAALGGDQLNPNVTIAGTLTFTGAGSFTVANIRLRTNSAAAIAVTGSSASVLNLYNCYLDFTNNTGITYSSSSSSSQINIDDCLGNLGTTGIGYFTHSSAGNLRIVNTSLFNTGGSQTASTCSAGTLTLARTSLLGPVTTSSTGVIVSNFTAFNCNAINSTALTHGGGVSSVENCSFGGGTASAISISNGSTLSVTLCNIGSSNTNSITGLGTINYNQLSFNGTSKTINTSTQTIAGTSFGSTTTAPTAGMLGERLEQTASAVAMVSNTAKTVASITLTPGVWDISAIASTTATGGTAAAQAFLVNISTTNNTVVGTAGIETFQTNATGTILSGSVPTYRVTTTSTPTYYLVCTVVYTSTTAPTTGRISATRVG